MQFIAKYSNSLINNGHVWVQEVKRKTRGTARSVSEVSISYYSRLATKWPCPWKKTLHKMLSWGQAIEPEMNVVLGQWSSLWILNFFYLRYPQILWKKFSFSRGTKIIIVCSFRNLRLPWLSNQRDRNRWKFQLQKFALRSLVSSAAEDWWVSNIWADCKQETMISKVVRTLPHMSATRPTFNARPNFYDLLIGNIISNLAKKTKAVRNWIKRWLNWIWWQRYQRFFHLAH